MSVIEIKNASVRIPVYNSQTRSIKNTVMGMASAGRIGVIKNGASLINSLVNVNLTINSSERIGIVGANGAGKSTLLRLISGVYTPCEGSVLVEGSVSSLIEISLGIDEESTGLENIYLRGALLGIPKTVITKKLDEIVSFSELGDFVYMPVRTYSSGMKMRLAFSVSTMVEPDILLMDEWLSVGDKSFKNKAEARLRRLIDTTQILVIASHSRNLIETCCTKVVWLEKGAIKKVGEPKEICKEYFG